MTGPAASYARWSRALKSRGYQAAVLVSSFDTDDTDAHRNWGYQVRNVSSQSSLSTLVRTCKSKCAPSGVHSLALPGTLAGSVATTEQV